MMLVLTPPPSCTISSTCIPYLEIVLTDGVWLFSVSYHLSNTVLGSPEEEEHTKISQPAGKKDKAKVAQKKKKKGRRSSVEAGEDTDEGDMESREVDYMTDSSSGSEQEFQVCRWTSEAMASCHILGSWISLKSISSSRNVQLTMLTLCYL